VIKRRISEALRMKNLPTDEIDRARASIACRNADAELLAAEETLRNAVETYDRITKRKGR